MRNSDRLLRALEGGAPAPPACAPLYLSLYLAPRRRKLLAQVYAEMAEGASSLRLTFEEELEAQVEALARALGLFAEMPAWAPVGQGPSRVAVHGAKVTFPPGQCLWHPPGGHAPVDYLAFYDNRHGDLWESQAAPTAAQVLAESPGAGADAWAEAGCLELPRRVLERLSGQCVPCAATGTPFWHCYARLGFAGMMRALRDDPDLIAAVCLKAAEPAVEHARALWDVGVRCMFVEECLSSSDLISVDDYLRFAFPPTRDLLVELKRLGFLVVYYYCGGVEGRLEHLASLPADALAFEESKKGFVIDLGRIRVEIGPDRLLFGNTDVTLVRDGDEEAMLADLSHQYAKAGPRFVASIGSPATLDTPPEKLDMLARATDRLA